MFLNKYDKIKITDKGHRHYGKTVYVISREKLQRAYWCALNDFQRCYVHDGQYKFIETPSKHKIPSYAVKS